MAPYNFTHEGETQKTGFDNDLIEGNFCEPGIL